MRLWMRAVYPASDHTRDFPATVFAESGGSEQRHHGIDRRRDQLDAFANSGIDQLGLYRGGVVSGRRSADNAAGAPVARDGWT